jgi:glycosyltransferase involved in cell wall biosynthesis
MLSPLLTIVTPSFNQAKFLEQTISSVLEQGYQPIEYIVVDGGSSDGSQEIIHKYATRLAWWVSEPDSGQAEAINKGLQRAKGEYVAWLNSDDLYLPGAIAQAVAALQWYPQASFVFGNARTIDPQGHELNQLVFGDWGLADLMRFRIICQPAVFIRRTALAQAGYLDSSLHCMLDHQLWLRLAQFAEPVHIGQTWAAARNHPDAKNAARAVEFSHETRRLLGWLKTHSDFRSRFQSDRRRIEAGAMRLSARYLLDGGQPGQALAEYGRALFRDPGYTLQHWRRIFYALASLVGGQRLRQLYYRFKYGRSKIVDHA